MMRTSGKFTPAAFTAITTSPSSATGSGTSTSSSVSGGPGLILNSAFMKSPLDRGSLSQRFLVAVLAPKGQVGEMTRRGYFLRLALSIVIDLFDLTLGHIPVFGTVNDGVRTVVLFALWGPAGLVNIWEVFDFTDFVDGFIPTATLIALYVGWREGMFGRGSRPVRDSATSSE